ncbi:hypothetical protein EXE30_04120 [Acinetobacter halotolerans]|uniref:Uncharacterized protein n=1 Tax=Acinetobacter halotolerans TaxID=1752076 RepID=A0A4Q6XLI2_9GAMM|nr:hypothetical protein EXE30_04120 [Acinetobacter halotolerans]
MDAQRSAYAAQQGLLILEQTKLNNKIELYKALGGGYNWKNWNSKLGMILNFKSNSLTKNSAIKKLLCTKNKAVMNIKIHN